MFLKSFSLFFLLLVFLFYSCGKSPPSSSSQIRLLTETIITQNFIFHYAPGNRVDTNQQEIYHNWAVKQFQISIPQKIDYYKYFDQQHMGELTGYYNTNAWADVGNWAIHTIWPVDNHECIHLYTSLIGSLSDFLVKA